jgi:hypothetical protein
MSVAEHVEMEDEEQVAHAGAVVGSCTLDAATECHTFHLFPMLPKVLDYCRLVLEQLLEGTNLGIHRCNSLTTRAWCIRKLDAVQSIKRLSKATFVFCQLVSGLLKPPFSGMPQAQQYRTVQDFPTYVCSVVLVLEC